MNTHRHGVVSEFVRVNQAAGKLVVGVGRQAVVDEKLCLRVERFGIPLHEAINLRSGRFRSSDRIGPRDSRNILSKAVAGEEAVEVAAFQTEAGQVVPSAHVFPRRWQAGNLPEDLEHSVVVKMLEDGMILFELLL